MPVEERTTNELFDGHGGIIGLEDSDGYPPPNHDLCLGSAVVLGGWRFLI